MWGRLGRCVRWGRKREGGLRCVEEEELEWKAGLVVENELDVRLRERGICHGRRSRRERGEMRWREGLL